MSAPDTGDDPGAVRRPRVVVLSPIERPPGGDRRRGRGTLRPWTARVAALTGAALQAGAASVAGGAVGSEYVGSAVLSLVVPALVGAACAWGATRGAVRWAGVVVPTAVVLAVAAVYAAVSAVLAFRVAATPLGGVGQWLPPVAAAVAGVALWPLIDPRPPVRPGRAGAAAPSAGLVGAQPATRTRRKRTVRSPDGPSASQSGPTT